MKKIFFWIQQIIKSKRHAPLRILLWLFSLFFYGGVFCKNFIYDYGLIRIRKVRKFVISVGNITAGGSGKTPFVIFLAEQLKKPCSILLRGYGVTIKKEKKVALEDDWHAVGDEALILKRHVSQAEVIVGKDRIRAAKMAANKIVILDDGLQYRKLFRDVEIIVVDGLDPFGHGYFLPRGFLRDTPQRLEEADIIVVNNVFSKEQESYVKRMMREYNKKSPILLFQPVVEGFYDLKENKQDDIKKVAMFCAIAHPEYFEKLLIANDIEVVDRLFYFDHEYIPDKVLEEFWIKAKKKGAETLICSEKDVVKLNIPNSIQESEFLQGDTANLLVADKRYCCRIRQTARKQQKICGNVDEIKNRLLNDVRYKLGLPVIYLKMGLQLLNRDVDIRELLLNK
jgi:tetraacyldisaccharide 4'-kinase